MSNSPLTPVEAEPTGKRQREQGELEGGLREARVGNPWLVVVNWLLICGLLLAFVFCGAVFAVVFCGVVLAVVF